MAKPLPIPLFKSPGAASKLVDAAELLADVCTVEYQAITGNPNEMPTRGNYSIPVCCVGRENDFWTLECNDHDLITDSQREELRDALRAWEISPAYRKIVDR